MELWYKAWPQFEIAGLVNMTRITIGFIIGISNIVELSLCGETKPTNRTRGIHLLPVDVLAMCQNIQKKNVALCMGTIRQERL